MSIAPITFHQTVIASRLAVFVDSLGRFGRLAILVALLTLVDRWVCIPQSPPSSNSLGMTNLAGNTEPWLPRKQRDKELDSS
jgi:hypothetical protein